MKALVVCVVIVAAGCKKPTPVADKDYFGKTVAPPRGLAKVRPGMTKQEAAAAGVTEIDPGDYGVPSGVGDIRLVALFDQIALDGRPVPRVEQILVYVHKPATSHFKEWLRDSWGAPVVDTEPLQVWQGDAWRAQVSCDRTEVTGCTISFSPAVTPAFWGHVPGALPAPLAKVKRGMSKHDIEALVAPGNLDDHIGVVFTGDQRPEGLSSVTLFLNKDHALPSLLTAWGDGQVVAGNHVYDDPTSGWRATLTSGVNVTLDYAPLAPRAP